MKTIATLFLEFLFIFSVSGQTIEPTAVKDPLKPAKTEFPNDVFVSYGYGSLYMTNPYVNHSFKSYPEFSELPDAATFGTISFGYNRNLSKVITLGFLAGYMNCAYTGDYSTTEPGKNLQASISDNIFNGMAALTLNYVNRPVVRIYSGFGMGVSYIFSTVQGTEPGSVRETKKQIHPAWQLTLFGIRFGRSFGPFFEIGVGSNTVLNGGICYQFSD